MSGGNSELAEAQEKLEQLQIEYDKAKDEWTGRLAAQQDEFQREKYVRPERMVDSTSKTRIFRDRTCVIKEYERMWARMSASVSVG